MKHENHILRLATADGSHKLLMQNRILVLTLINLSEKPQLSSTTKDNNTHQKRHAIKSNHLPVMLCLTELQLQTD